MSANHDILLLQQPSPCWFNAAGLVFEWIGHPRWRTIDPASAQQHDDVLLVDRRHVAERTAHRPAQPAIIEVITEQTITLPCQFVCEQTIDRALAPLEGLYTNLDNYNGMRGMQRPWPVPVPVHHPRATPRRLLDDRSAIHPPPDPVCCALSHEGDVLVQTVKGQPLVVQHEQCILLGLPLFSILAQHLTAPPMDGDSYIFSEPVHHLAMLLHGLTQRIAPAGTVSVAPWPNDAMGVFALRHDYDRPTDLVNVVQREADLNVRPTIHVLADQLPTDDEIDAIHHAQGEIALHSRWLDHMAIERMNVAKHIKSDRIGHSAHGGRDADGWRGWRNLAAAHRAGIPYTELLSEMHLWPHRIVDLADPHMRPLAPLAMPHHLSFDVNMREHDGDRLIKEAASIFANRGLFTLMNHPDIHVEAMLAFLEQHVPVHVPRMTLDHVERWWRATHTQDCLQLTTSIDTHSKAVRIEGTITAGQIGLVLNCTLPKHWLDICDITASAGVRANVVCEGGLRVRLALDVLACNGFSVSIHAAT